MGVARAGFRSAFATAVVSLADGIDPSAGEVGLPYEGEAVDWPKMMFPDSFDAPMAFHHEHYWDHLETADSGERVDPYALVLGRGGGKTTNLEAGSVYLTAEKRRRFVLYVKNTQEQANDSLSAIASLLEKENLSTYYPEMAKPRKGKYRGNLAWNVSTLRTADGANFVAYGLDSALRGIKLDKFRPDVIVLDDIDPLNASANVINKNIKTITRTLLPAGSSDVFVMIGQNLIRNDGFVGRLVSGEADYLTTAVVNGPIPAIRNMIVEKDADGRWRIISGEATWEGQSIEIAESQIELWGLIAFKQEANHEVSNLGGVWDNIEFEYCPHDDLPDIVKYEVWADPAVTATDESDSAGVVVDGLGSDDKVYRFYAEETVEEPDEVVMKALLLGIRFGASYVGFETNQGGNLWRSTYRTAVAKVRQNPEKYGVSTGQPLPKFKEAKASVATGSKIERSRLMMASYKMGNVIHVVTDEIVPLETALRRFPNKPLDLADGAYWSWWSLLGKRKKAKVGTAG